MRKEVLIQAKEYVDARHGARAKTAKWLAGCLMQEPATVNPFCRYEIERRASALTTRKSTGGKATHRLIAKDLAAERYDSATRRTWGEMVGASSALSSDGQIDAVVNRILEAKDCVSASIPAALGYKLEERFPDKDAVDVVERLYRKAVACGSGFALTQASFRLGLIQVWRGRCDEVGQLMSKVEADREATPYHARARYWKFHCATARNDGEGRTAARESLLKENPMTFQTLAAWSESDDPAMRILERESPRVAMRSIVRSDLNPLVRATEALVKLKAKTLAAEIVERNIREIGTMEPELRLYFATLMNQISHALPKFRILNDLFQDVPQTVSEATLKLYFPLWYMDEVKSSGSYVDPLLIVALIRQESAFDKTARSPVGARGLMQVMPGTARMVGRVRANKLYDPVTNIGVGTKYFMKRLEQYDGDVEFTLAAYNAGFSRVDQWRKRYPTDNKLLFLDLIPFRETRDYVSSILRNYYWYVRLYGTPAEPSSLEAKNLIGVNPKFMAIVSAQAGRAAVTEKK